MRSLKIRLIVGAIVWIASGISVAGFFVSALFRQHVQELADAELSGHLEELVSLLETDSRGQPYLHRRLSDPRFGLVNSGFYWQVSENGKLLLRSASIADHAIPIPGPDPQPGETRRLTLQAAHGPIVTYDRMVMPAGRGSPLRIQIGADEVFVDHIMAHFNLALAWSLGLLFMALVAAAVLQVAFGLRPMAALRHALARVRSGQDKRLPRDFPHEIQPLIDDLNGLIDANAQMVQRARAQAGNLAHGLKTPLAVLTDEAYRLSARGDAEAAATIIQQCQRMQRQIDYQIARARAAASRSVPGVVAPVDKTVTAIVSAMKRLHADRALIIDIDIPAGCVAICDPMDLNEMLANLIDNACKWAAGRVGISAATDAATRMLTIAIDDDGPGLSPESRDFVFQIGTRLDERVPGTGLGLPIVRDLAQLYGGNATLADSPLGGLRASLQLPAALAG